MVPDSLDTERRFELAFREAVACFPPPAELQDAISKRVGQVKAAQAASLGGERAQSALRKQGKSVTVLKWAVGSAVACAAAAILAALLSSGRPVVPSAYAEVAEAIQNSQSAEWVHTVSSDGQMEAWFCLEPHRVIQKSAQGAVTFDDGDTYESLRYDPQQNTIRIEDSILDSDAKEFASVLGYIMSKFAEERGRGAAFDTSEDTVNGARCMLYRVGRPGEEGSKVLLVGLHTSRVVRFEMIERGQQVVMDFDYPASGPGDIYALGVPRDARIIDVRTRDEQSNRMLADAKAAEQRFDRRFRAIVVTGPFDQLTGRMAAASIDVYYQAKERRRTDRWMLSHSAGPLDHADSDALQRYMQAHRPSSVAMTVPDGGTVFYRELASSQSVRKRVDPSTRLAGLQGIMWKTLRWQYGRAVPDREGTGGSLLGARRVEPAGISAGVVHRRPIQWTIYLNPQRDYIAERYEEWAGGLYESWVPREGVDDTTVIAPHVGKPRKSTTTVLEYAKTPTGHWYARKLLTEGDFQGRSGTFMRVVDIDTDYTFPEGLFSPEAFERDLGRTVTTD